MKRELIFAFVLVIAITLFGCNQSDINIGFVAGLTEVNSELGVSGMYGSTMAVEEINSTGGINGRKINLIIKDDKNNPDTAVNVDTELVDSGCPIIVGHYISSISNVAVDFANKRGILLISPTITTDSMNDINDNFIRLSPSVSKQADALYKLILHEKRKNCVIVYNANNSAYAENMKDVLMKLSESKDRNIKSTIAFSSVSSFVSGEKIKGIKRINPDGIIIVAAADDTAEICQRLRSLKINSAIYFSTWAMTNDLIEHGGKTVEGAQGINFVNFASDSKKYIDFKTKFFAKYGTNPDFSALVSYETIMLVKEALLNVNSFSVADLKKYILGKGTFDGLQDEYKINEFGDCLRQIYLCKITNRTFVAVKINE